MSDIRKWMNQSSKLFESVAAEVEAEIDEAIMPMDEAPKPKKYQINPDELKAIGTMDIESAKAKAKEIINLSSTNDQRKSYLIRQVDGHATPTQVQALLYNMLLSGEGLGSVSSNYATRFDKPEFVREGLDDGRIGRYNMTIADMEEAVEVWNISQDLTSELVSALIRHHDEMPFSAVNGDPTDWLRMKGHDVAAIDEIRSELEMAGSEASTSDAFHDPDNIESELSSAPLEVNQPAMDVIPMRESEDNLDGLEQDDDGDVERDLANMDRFQDKDQRDNYELAPIGARDASVETDEAELLFAIEDYQDRGMSGSEKTYDVNKLRDMPYAIIKKIHELVVGIDEVDDEMEEPEMEKAVSEDGSNYTGAIPGATTGIPDATRMIKDIDDSQKMGVSGANVTYNVEKLKTASPETLKKIHALVMNTDKVKLIPDHEYDHASPTHKAMEAADRITESQNAAMNQMRVLAGLPPKK